MNNKLILICFLLFALTACEEALVPEDASSDPHAVFDAAWTFTDEYYCYFDFKGVDWDSVRTVYEPRIRDTMTDRELFEVLADMLAILRDGHVSLSSPLRTFFYDFEYLYPANYDPDIVAKHYLIQGNVPTVTRYPGFRVGMLPGDILYVNYTSFNNPEEPLADILEDFPNSQGMILDVRGNGGGQNDAYLASYFTDTEKLVGYYLQKSGPGHNDFTERLPIVIQPGTVFYDKKVAVLTNRECFSGTAAFVQHMKSFDNVVQVGDTTGGGGAAPIEKDLPNGWGIYVSSNPAFGVDGFNYEPGTPPDIVVMDNPITLEVDEIIERALEEF